MDPKAPIDFNEPIFTQAEAVEISGTAKKNIENWRTRGLMDVGRLHRTGRWLYSIFDLIELATMTELSSHIAIPPLWSRVVAAQVRLRCVERSATGALKLDSKDSHAYFVLWFGADPETPDDPAEMSLHWYEDWKWVTKAKIRPAHPFLVFPVDDMFMTIAKRAMDVIERESIS